MTNEYFGVNVKCTQFPVTSYADKAKRFDLF